ncbi:hypothetical protein Hanom_Chr14g01319381 [Helianthus anomalus]
MCIHMFVCNTPKNPKLGHIRCFSRPCLKRCFSFNGTCRGSIEDVYSRSHCFSPKEVWHLLVFKHTSYHPHNGAVLPLHHTIKLRCVWSGKFPSNSLLLTETVKFFRTKLPPSVSTQHFYKTLTLLFN